MPSQANRRAENMKGRGARYENNKIYALPLPLKLGQSSHNHPFSTSQYLLGLFAWFHPRLENPRCEGIFDPLTRSVWISNPRDKELLWRRGFFGKGNLSRSEPTWHSRTAAAGTSESLFMPMYHTCANPTCETVASEQIREKRRQERKQFKQDRATALAQAAAEAEAAFHEGREASMTAIPSGATWKPTDDLRFSSFNWSPFHEHNLPGDQAVREDPEHLQLTLQEAFFLAWNLECLDIFGPDKVTFHLCIIHLPHSPS